MNNTQGVIERRGKLSKWPMVVVDILEVRGISHVVVVGGDKELV